MDPFADRRCASRAVEYAADDTFTAQSGNAQERAIFANPKLRVSHYTVTPFVTFVSTPAVRVTITVTSVPQSRVAMRAALMQINDRATRPRILAPDTSINDTRGAAMAL